MTTQIEELVNRLRKPYEDILRSKWPINPDGPDAAVKLEAQAARIKELEAQLKLERQNSKDVINAAEEHISTLEAQLESAIRKALNAATAVDGNPSELREQLTRMSLAVQRDCDAEWNAAIEAAAIKATSFLVGDPLNGIPLRSPTSREIADAIRSLKRP